MSVRAAAVLVIASLLAGCSGGSSEDGYDPIVLGRYHEYRVTVGGGSFGTSRWQIVAASATGFTRTVQTVQGTTFEHEVLVDGDAEYVTSTTTRASDGTLVATNVSTPAYVLLSADDAPGSNETTVSTVTVGAGTYQSTRSVTVDGVETVTVPAGTFTALKTTAHITDSQGWDGYNVNWWARGVGRVKVVSYPAAIPASGTTYELTDVGDAAVP